MLNPFEVHSYLIASAKRADLQVVWVDDGVPRTDGKKVYLPRITSSTEEKHLSNMAHYVAHEVSHVKYSDMDLLQKYGLDPRKSLLAALNNLLEDQRIDRINGAIYEGDRQHCDSFLSDVYTSEKLADKFSGALKKAQGEGLQNMRRLGAAMLWDSENRGDMFPLTEQSCESFREDVEDKDMHNYHQRLAKGDYAEVLKSIVDTYGETLEGSTHIYDLSKRIYKEVFDLDPQAEEKRNQEEMASGGKGKGKPEKAEEGDEETKGTSATSRDGTVPYEEFLPHQNMPKGITSKSNLFIDYSGYTGSNTYTPSERAGVVDFPKNKTEGMTMPSMVVRDPRIEKSASQICVNQDGFASKVRSLLQIKSRGRTEYGTKRGKLHKANIHRLALKDSGSLSEKIFKRKITSDVLDTCVQIVIDISGSMGGDKIIHAAAGGALLQHTLGNTLHIPIEVLGFSDAHGPNDAFGSCVNMYIYRAFDNPLLGTDEFLNRVSRSLSGMSSNPDGDALMWAHRRIKNRKEKRKLMIVLSDGSPAAGRHGDIDMYTKQAVSYIEKSPVQIVGIGIKDRNVERYYTDRFVIHSSDQIEEALLSLIKRKVL